MNQLNENRLYCNKLSITSSCYNTLCLGIAPIDLIRSQWSVLWQCVLPIATNECQLCSGWPKNSKLFKVTIHCARFVYTVLGGNLQKRVIFNSLTAFTCFFSFVIQFLISNSPIDIKRNELNKNNWRGKYASTELDRKDYFFLKNFNFSGVFWQNFNTVFTSCNVKL